MLNLLHRIFFGGGAASDRDTQGLACCEMLEPRLLLSVTTYETHAWNGVPLASTPDDMKTRLYAFVGDHSSSNSEIWKMRVGDQWYGWDGWITAPDYGQVAGELPSQGPGRHFVDLLDGQSYKLDVEHVSTNGSEGPDYDYRAWLDHRANPGWTTPQELPYGSNANGAQNPNGTVNYFVTDTAPSGEKLLQKRWFDDNQNHDDPTPGKTAWLHIPGVDLDVDSDNTNGWTAPSGVVDVEDVLETDTTTGKVVPINIDDYDMDGVPDYADFDGITGLQFVPVTIKLSSNLADAGADISDVILTFNYAASSPMGLTPNAQGIYPPPSSSGHLRLWRRDAGVRELGDYIAPDSSFTAQDLDLNFGVAKTFYVEAVAPSAYVLPITLTATVQGEAWSGTLTDRVHVAAAGINLTVDSNNDGTIDDADDAIEDDTSLAGKWIELNYEDSDGDIWVPDYADGYGLLNGSSHIHDALDDSSLHDAFTQARLEVELPPLPQGLKGQVRFTYSDNDPLNGVDAPGFGFWITDGGHLRLWNKNASDARNGASMADGGDFIPSEVWIDLDELNGDAGIYAIYIEGTWPSASLSDLPIKSELRVVDAGGSAIMQSISDQVHVTTVGTRDGWQTQALQRADVNPAAWNPALGMHVNRVNVLRIYDYYRKTFNRDADLLWAGLGRMAGGAVYNGLEQLRTIIDATGDPLGILVPLENRFLQMHKDVFDDLAWQHEAYLTGGLNTLELLDEYKPADLPAGVLAAWTDIAGGAVSGGNRKLLEREQSQILQPHWTVIGGGPIPSEVLDQMTAGIFPGNQSFSDYSDLIDSITVYADRWDWITVDMWPVWVAGGAAWRTAMANAPLGSQVQP